MMDEFGVSEYNIDMYVHAQQLQRKENCKSFGTQIIIMGTS